LAHTEACVQDGTLRGTQDVHRSRSGGFPVVVAEEATKAFPTLHRPISREDIGVRGLDEALAEALRARLSACRLAPSP
jgi:hypothetical protein